MAARAQHSGPAANGGGAPALLPLLLLLLSAAAIIPRGTALPGPARRGRLAAFGVGAGSAAGSAERCVPGRGFHGSGRSCVRMSVCRCGFETSGAPPPDLLAAECNFRALLWKLLWLLVGEARGAAWGEGGGGRSTGGNGTGWNGCGGMERGGGLRGDCWRVGARRCAPCRSVPPAIVASPCTEPNSRRRDRQPRLMALIEYPSLMPLYICSVSLETHKASFSGSCDESSSRCWPCKFGRNKRAIEQSVEFRRYRKGGEERSGQLW